MNLAAEVASVIDAVPDPGVRADSRAFAALLTEVTGEPAWLGSPKIIGFGHCLYRRGLDEIDRDVLGALIDRSVRHVDQTVAALGALPRMDDMPPFVED